MIQAVLVVIRHGTLLYDSFHCPYNITIAFLFAIQTLRHEAAIQLRVVGRHGRSNARVGAPELPNLPASATTVLTIGAAGLNHLLVTEVLPQGNANAPRASIRRLLAPAVVLYSVRLNNPILNIPPDAVILYCSLISFPVAHPMADSDL
ncbi:hypothetical protein PIB30_078218 [Stylosanthes scabra]|uniref:Uncharacterized protein n=1 Tax=Stylosanthes scabra TaxID=79078 RepID=A0ABU6TRG3_9FABA|nr:hypothetical protein [Stylosanthes scabra]